MFGALYVLMTRFLIPILFLFPNIVLGKCINEFHKVSGHLVNDNVAVANAKISIEFYDGLEKLIKNSIITDENGKYAIELGYNKYSGSSFFGSDKCEFVLKKFQLKIEAKGIQTFKELVKVSDEKTTYNKQFKNGRLPAAL